MATMAVVDMWVTGRLNLVGALSFFPLRQHVADV